MVIYCFFVLAGCGWHIFQWRCWWRYKRCFYFISLSILCRMSSSQ